MSRQATLTLAGFPRMMLTTQLEASTLTMQDFFSWLGSFLGELIRFVVDLLSRLYRHVSDAARGFLDGLTESLGIAPSLISVAILAIGLWLLYLALRALLRRRLIATVVWGVLGVMVLSWLIT